MKKSALLIILIIFLGLLVFTKNVVIKSNNQGKELDNKTIEILEKKEVPNQLEIGLEIDLEKKKIEEEEVVNEEEKLNEEELEMEDIVEEVVNIPEVKKEDTNWETSLNTTSMLLPYANSEEKTEANTHVVIHFISNAVNNQKSPYKINDIYSILEQYGVSSNYVIGRDGEIYLFVPENRVAYHAGPGTLLDYPKYENRLNQYSIGIELLAIGTREEMIPVITAEKFDLIDPNLLGYTDAQYESLNSLLNDILERNHSIKRDRKHIIGHDEYNPTGKTDPGDLFDWGRIGF